MEQLAQTRTVSAPTNEIALEAPPDAPDLDKAAPATDYVPGHELVVPAAHGFVEAIAAPVVTSAAAKAPVEGKVWSATIGAGAGTALSSLVLWVLGVFLWHASPAATAAVQAIAAVPESVSAVVGVGVPAGVAFLAGYRAKHTPRTGE